MKRYISIMAVTLAASVMAVILAVSSCAAVGTVIYAFRTDEAPNMDEIDSSWGEPAVHVTKDSPNAELVKFWPVHLKSGNDTSERLAIEPEDSEFDLYALYDGKYLYAAIRSPDGHIHGGHIGDPHRGDGIHLWIQTLDSMEDPYGPCGQHKGLTEDERHSLEDVYLFFWNLGEPDNDVLYGDAALQLEDAPRIVIPPEGGEIQCLIKIPLEMYGLRKKDPHGTELGITIQRISSINSLDEGFAGWLTWGKTYEEYTPVPESVNTMILWDLSRGEPGIVDSGNEGTEQGDTEDTAAEVTPNLEGVSSWALAEVEAGIKEGLVPANLQANYTSPVTRGAVAQMFVNLLEKAAGKSIDDIMAEKGVAINEGAFTDTTDKAVLAANALGIINGTGSGKFSPDGTLKRAQIAAIINRVARVMGIETDGFTHEFND
ncbi:MAG: S-layer homology domain-containing protein, partial [Clostridia bacterium]|nr:S-layer homology domain-containing protein [Clostridia bacterium]